MQVVSESETAQNDDLSSLNLPALLEFEGGEGDIDANGARDKRTPRFIFRTVSCLFTFLINPGCLQGITGGLGGGSGGSSFSGGSSSSSSSNRRENNAEPYYMISLPRYNESDSNGTATEYPIYPIENTSEYTPEEPSRPTNPLMQLFQWKLNLIPNMLRRFFPGFGGGRRDDGGSLGGGSGGGLLSLLGGGGGGGGFNLGSLGLGQGRLFGGLFGGRQNNAGGGGGFGGGLGGLGFGGAGGQY